MRRIALSALAFLLLTVAAMSGGSKQATSTTQVSTAVPVVMIVHPQSHKLLEDAHPTTTTITVPAPETVEPPPEPVKKAAVAVTATTEAAPQPEPEQQQPVPSGDAESAIAQWFPDLYQSAVNVATCESGMDPGAVSRGGGNWGLFQINTVHRSDFENYTGQPWSEVLNANYNAQYARKLYDGNGGWGPWTCRYAA